MSTFITKHAKAHGLKKKDAKRPLVIEISEGDIEKASPQNPMQCAFAVACKRGDRAIKAAYFFRTAAWLQYPKSIVRYTLPGSVQKEIVAFDRGHTMEPGTYSLKAPPPSQTMQAIQTRSKKRRGRHEQGNGKIKRNVVVHKTTGIREYHDLEKIASKKGRKTLEKIASKKGRKTLPVGRQYTIEERDEILEAAAEVGVVEAARRHGVPQTTVSNWRNRDAPKIAKSAAKRKPARKTSATAKHRKS